jgi:hypothetical protein
MSRNNSTNMFMVLASDSEGEEPSSSQLRSWKNEENRFKNEDPSIIFKSPFSKNRDNAWSRPQFANEDASWVSIAKEEAVVPVKELSQVFPSLLSRGADKMNANAWAEKIKKRFEKSDKGRFEFKKQKSDISDNFGEKLSFFRRVGASSE